MPSDIESTRRWLNDILFNIDAAEEFTRGLTLERFKTDRLRIYGVTRCLEIISEASRRLTDPLKARNPSIPWQQIAAAGNIYRHEYETVAAAVIWRTLKHDLPLLRDIITGELAALLNWPPFPRRPDGNLRPARAFQSPAAGAIA